MTAVGRQIVTSGPATALDQNSSAGFFAGWSRNLAIALANMLARIAWSVALYLNFTLSRTTRALPPAEGITCSPPHPMGGSIVFNGAVMIEI
jgi:hypothetical protein